MVDDSDVYTKIFLFNATATAEIYTLSLHDALPISAVLGGVFLRREVAAASPGLVADPPVPHRSEEHTSDSSHVSISYAVFCLKKKTTRPIQAALPCHASLTLPTLS